MQELLSKGVSSKKEGFAYGILTTSVCGIHQSKKILILSNDITDNIDGYAGYILYKNQAAVVIPDNVFYIETPLAVDIDSNLIVKIDYSSGEIYTICDLSKGHLDLYLTGKCSQKCIACPQPKSSRVNMHPEYEALYISRVLAGQKVHINISGGEPTLHKSYFKIVIKSLQENVPSSKLQILTNAIAFSKKSFIESLVDYGITFDNLFFSVALYGSHESLQDKLTGCKGSFHLLQRAINNILSYGAEVEIRIVINKLNYQDLYAMSEFIVSSFNHKIKRVVFMGIEMSGDAGENHEMVWIPFEQHQDSLKKAVYYLLSSNMNVYFYNYPLCYLPRNLWSLSKDSISEWKKFFLDECSICTVKKYCAGFFKSTVPFITHIDPIKGE